MEKEKGTKKILQSHRQSTENDQSSTSSLRSNGKRPNDGTGSLTPKRHVPHRTAESSRRAKRRLRRRDAERKNITTTEEARKIVRSSTDQPSAKKPMKPKSGRFLIFYKVGQRIAELRKEKGGKIEVKKFSGVEKLKTFHINKAISHIEPDEGTKSTFSSYYRSLAGKHDELISTRGIECIINGFREKDPSPEGKLVLDKIINIFSALRFPTSYSGYNNKGVKESINQHPAPRVKSASAASSGEKKISPHVGPIFTYENDKKTYLHFRVNQARDEEVCDAFIAALNDKDNSLDLVIKKGLASAIRFTLNRFTAPAMAKNQTIYVVGDPGKKQQTLMREKLKSYYHEMSGSEEMVRKTQAITADYKGGAKKVDGELIWRSRERGVSPERVEEFVFP